MVGMVGGEDWYGGGGEHGDIPKRGLSKGSYLGGLGKFPRGRKFSWG